MGTSGFVMLDQRVALLSPCRAQVFASPPGSSCNIWDLKGFFLLLLLFARKMKCECSAHPIIMEESGLKKKKRILMHGKYLRITDYQSLIISLVVSY